MAHPDPGRYDLIVDAQSLVEDLAQNLGLGSLMAELANRFPSQTLLAHWKQGEFHHDLVFDVPELEGALVAATNCNGVLKELILLDETPDRWALWNWRCPDNPEFEGELPHVVARTTTTHFFDPCELLLPDARSEIRPEFRERMRGGGWQLKQQSD